METPALTMGFTCMAMALDENVADVLQKSAPVITHETNCPSVKEFVENN